MKNTIPPKWPITCNRHVAYLEMFNFKELMENEPSMKLAGIIVLLKEIEKPKNTSTDQISEKKSESNLIKCTLFAESILIVSRDLSQDCTIHFIGSLMRVQTALLRLGVPLRGGLSKKLMTADFRDNTFLGAALIEACSVCKSLLFYGVAERSEDQDLDAVDNYRNIAPDKIPLYFPKFSPTTSGSMLLLIINLSLAAQSTEEVTGLFSQLKAPITEEERKFLSNSLGIFKAAYSFTYPHR